MLQLPGANAGKPDVKGAADKAVKKSPLGFMNVGELAFDLPGSGVSKDDLPNNVKPGDAAGLPKGPTAKPPSAPSLPKVQSEYSLLTKVVTCNASHGLEQYAVSCWTVAKDFEGVCYTFRFPVTLTVMLSQVCGHVVMWVCMLTCHSGSSQHLDI